MDLTQFEGLFGVPFVVGITELIKRAMQDDDGVDHLPVRLMPVLDLAIGVALNLGLALMQGKDLSMAVFVGIITGMAAAGFYSGSKAIVGN